MRVGVVGFGPHGQRVVDAARAVEGLELAAVIDRSETVRARAEDAGTPAFASLEDAFRAAPLDVVCVATNGPSHAPIAIEAMRRGARAVFIEKPMACSVVECEQIASVAAETGARVCVDHPRRVNAGYLWIRDRILSGEWGELRSIWVQRPGIGLGCLGTHTFDLVRALSGLEVTRVTAFVDPSRGPNPRGAEFVDPGGLVVLELGADVRATCVQIEDGAGPMTVEVHLTKARVRCDEQTGEVEVVTRDPNVKKGPDRPAAYRRDVNPDGRGLARNLRGEIEALLREIATEAPLSAGVDDGTRSIEILAAAWESHRRGNVPIALPLASEDARRAFMAIT